MQHSAKYIIHADIRTSGVVERSDVVGAIFGQTEGLLGDDMDLRDLQDASKVGRIDVDIESEGGRSFGTVQIASGMDRAETAVLAAALETIERVGPCRANCSIIKIEDARAAKRREIVDRATELLAAFEDEQLTSERLVEEVRQRVREAEMTEYCGFPAGPNVTSSDAIIVVEGRADVRKLLSIGIKNAVAVEGTDVPEDIARLSNERTTTAFLDGDRGGDLILRELAQVGNVDYVAFAPSDQSVEDLDRTAIMAALRKKLPYEQIDDEATPREAFAPTGGGSTTPPESTKTPSDGQQTTNDAARGPRAEISDVVEQGPDTDRPDETAAESVGSSPNSGAESADGGVSMADSTPIETGPEIDDSGSGHTTGDREPERASKSTKEENKASIESDETAEPSPADEGESSPAEQDESARDDDTAEPLTLGDHVAAVIESEAGTVRLLDEDFTCLVEADGKEAFETIESAETVPHSVVLDGEITQRLLDVAAQRGVGQIIGTDTGNFVKQPASVRVHIADEIDIN